MRVIVQDFWEFLQTCPLSARVILYCLGALQHLGALSLPVFVWFGTHCMISLWLILAAVVDVMTWLHHFHIVVVHKSSTMKLHEQSIHTMCPTKYRIIQELLAFRIMSTERGFFKWAVLVIYNILRSYVIVEPSPITVQSFQPLSFLEIMENTWSVGQDSAAFRESWLWGLAVHLHRLATWSPPAEVRTHILSSSLSFCLSPSIYNSWLDVFTAHPALREMLKFRNPVLLLTESLNHEWLTFCFSDCSLFCYIV